MKRLYTLLVFLIFFHSAYAGTLFSDGFENPATLFTVTGGTYFTGQTTAPSGPSLVNQFTQGSYSVGKNNGIATLATGDIDVSACSNIKLTFDVMAISQGSSGNGMEFSDSILVEISPNGGTTYYKRLTITGSSTSNAYWGWNSALATNTYAADNFRSIFSATATGDRTATGDGYSKVEITGLPAAANLRIKITLRNNATAETWLIDNFVLSGDCGVSMDVRGGSPIATIADGDATPSTADSTIFKNTCLGSSSTVTYTVRNTGTSDLLLNGSPKVQVGGTHASDFSVTVMPKDTVGASATSTFTVTFTPGAAGTRSATLSIPNNDPGTNKNPYNFSIQGTGVAMATPSVSIAITSGSNPSCAGSSVTFTATASNIGGGTVTYQWKVNGSNVGTNSATYSSSALASTDVVTCSISIASGACLNATTATSSSITMTVNPLPSTPPNPTAAANPACTSTILNTMSPPGGVTYYWQGTTNNGTSTTNNTSSTYTVSSTGTYYVRAQDNTTSCWSSGSGSLLVTINTPVSISPQPTDQTVNVGATATFSLTASGTAPITYQWQVSTDGGGIYNNVSTGTGGTTNSYTTPATTVSMNGYKYRCNVTNTCGTVTSTAANLYVSCFNESFTSTGFPYAGWENVNTFAARITSNFRTTPACMSLDIGYLGEIRLPKVNRPSSLSFWISKSSANAENELVVQVSTVHQRTGYVQIASFTDADIPGTNTYTQKTIDLTAYSEYDAVFVNFVSYGTATSTSVYRLDDIQFTCSASTCSTAQNVPGAHGNPGNASAILNWYYPACFDEIMIVANTTAGIGFSPSGNGSAYTANSVYGGVNSVVYKGTGNNQTVTGLTNGTTYYFEIFTRKGTNWSSGYEIKVTPVAAPTHCLSNFLDISDEFISKVQVANINNPSYVYDGFADYTYIQSDVERSLDYPITVSNGQDFGLDTCYVWVDWNHDGIFSNTVGTPTGAGERYVMTGVGGGTAQFTGTITVPNNVAVLDGLARMRVTLGYDLSSPTVADCSTSLEYGETEDYMLNVLAPCTPDFTVTNFYPKSGTAESWIRITGTNLTNVTNISINGIAVTNYQISATEIRMELPAGATTGKITLANAANCKVLTSAPFTVIAPDNGSCSSGGATNLFISELFDPGSGNNHYIEIFNGTGSAVTLSNYSLQVVNISTSGTFPGTSYTLTGTLAANATVVVWAGNAGSLANQGGPTNGFNADDEIRLYQGASVIDRITCPTIEGYSLIRNASILSPSSTYVGSQWNITLNPNQSTANIGLHSFNGTPSLTITTLPTDQTVAPCDAATFSFNVSGSGVSFQWVVNDMTTDTWSNVSTGGAYTVTSTSTSTTLVVNPMAYKDSFQFYCIVTSGSCIKYVRAVQLYEGVNNKPVFRSVATADSNWTTIANWQFATSELGPWTNACVYPTADNSTRVIISDNSYIKLNFVNAIDSIEIRPNGTLELAPGSQFTINNGFASGPDYIILGTLYDNTDNSTVFSSGATWLMGDTAKIIKSRNSSTNVYRDNYQGGIANIPATAHWKIRYIGTSQPSVASIGMYYPNLYWENYTGTHYNFSSSSSAMRGGSGFTTVKGNMKVGITGISSVSVFNNNYNSSPMLIMGNLEVGASSLLTTASSNGTENEGTGFELQGNVTIEGNLNVIQNIVYPSSARIVKFSGNNPKQVVSGNGIINISNMEINKSGNNYVKLDRILRANESITMNGGHFVVDVDTSVAFSSLNYLELGSSISNIGTLTVSNPNSFVIGKMRRWFDATSNSGDASSLFPIGANDTLRHIGFPDAIRNRNLKVEFTSAPSVGGSIEVFFMQKDMSIAGLPIHIDPVGGCTSFDAYFTENQGFWQVRPGGGLSGGTYTITAIGEGFTTIDPSSLCNLTLLKRPDNTSTWYSLGTHEEPAGTITKPILKRSGLTSFSDFGYAGGILNILPIELESFTGSCESEQNRLDWVTASESNNDYFVLEKSLDQNTFFPIDTIEGAGNSNSTLYYSTIDINQTPSYYRLRQVDYDGNSTFSPLIWLNCSSSYPDGIQVYFDGNSINALISVANNKSFVANIYNAKGQIVYTENFDLQKGLTRKPLGHAKLASGIYIVNVFDGLHQSSYKVFVQ